ncbi:E3 ubiquitin-protein ligase RNF25-like [Culicoides brevitarsis]|uniref:E3 ubiquitin-protein ligase RNF25-like n=1 Tax=Culicoides brevitarsis TaxID=469753 RepID=UPI00307B5171
MEALIDEVESLEAILMEDVQITRNPDTNFPELIETTVFPTTCEDTERQYVCITLQIMPTKEYPETKPDFKLRNPRGLDDACINAIEKAIIAKLDESIGLPVVFDLIDLIRECLTESNVPTGQCVICLYGFQEGDDFTKTSCYHYLHSHCLAIWLQNAKRNFNDEQSKLPNWQRSEAKPFQSSCPVCREPIDIDIERLKEAKTPQELENAPQFTLTEELKQLQAEMTKLFLHQKQNGGIIDTSVEDKTLIAIDPEGAANEPKRKPAPPPQTDSAKIRSNQQPSNSAQKKQQQQQDDENESEEDEVDDRRRRIGGRRDRYYNHKGKRNYGRHRNHDSNR